MPASSKYIDCQISVQESSAIKGVAVCLLLIRHLFLVYRDSCEAAFQIGLISKVCIAFFVFTSGYGLAVQYEKWSTTYLDNQGVLLLKFLGRRLTKFYLNYWFIFLISVPVGVFIFDHSLQMSYGEDANTFLCLLKDFLGLQGLKSYNATWWFNSLALSLYVLFPVLFFAMRSWMVGLSLLVLFYVWPKEILWPLQMLCNALVTYLIVFALGMYVACRQKAINDFLNRLSPWLVLPFSAVLLALLFYIRNHVVFPSFCGVGVDPFLALFFSLFIVCACRLTSCKLKVFEFLGKHSMNIYLLHSFFIGCFGVGGSLGLKNPLAVFSSLLAFTLLLSVFVEFLKTHIGFYKLLDFLVVKMNPEKNK